MYRIFKHFYFQRQNFALAKIHQVEYLKQSETFYKFKQIYFSRPGASIAFMYRAQCTLLTLKSLRLYAKKKVVAYMCNERIQVNGTL